jgi:hypothetical protein
VVDSLECLSVGLPSIFTSCSPPLLYQRLVRPLSCFFALAPNFPTSLPLFHRRLRRRRLQWTSPALAPTRPKTSPSRTPLPAPSPAETTLLRRALSMRLTTYPTLLLPLLPVSHSIRTPTRPRSRTSKEVPLPPPKLAISCIRSPPTPLTSDAVTP